MAAPRFRFVETSPPVSDDQFRRDVEASERLGSRFKANLFLRELCHVRAWTTAGAAGSDDHFVREERERALLREVAARGYRLSGAELGAAGGAALALAG